MFQVIRKIDHIRISVPTNFHLNWLSGTLIIAFLRFKINFQYYPTLTSSNFTTWRELLALKPRTVSNLLSLLSECDLLFFFTLRVEHSVHQSVCFPLFSSLLLSLALKCQLGERCGTFHAHAAVRKEWQRYHFMSKKAIYDRNSNFSYW